jgi:hypothetical protein
MSAVPFDTLKLADKLEAGGFTPTQARTAASAFAEAMSGAYLATKADIADVRRDIEIAKHELTIRLGGMLVVATGILLAAIRYLPAGH